MRKACLVLIIANIAAILPAIAAERLVNIDLAQSRVDVVVRASLDSFTASLRRFEPVVKVNDDGQIVAARVTFHFRDVVTGKDKRDREMHVWQQTDTFPDGAFELSGIEPASAPSKGLIGAGRLTFHGVTHHLRFPVTVLRDGSTYTIDGDATLDTREFGLPVIRMLAVLKVDPVVHVRFHLQGRADS